MCLTIDLTNVDTFTLASSKACTGRTLSEPNAMRMRKYCIYGPCFNPFKYVMVAAPSVSMCAFSAAILDISLGCKQGHPIIFQNLRVPMLLIAGLECCEVDFTCLVRDGLESFV